MRWSPNCRTLGAVHLLRLSPRGAHGTGTHRFPLRGQRTLAGELAFGFRGCRGHRGNKGGSEHFLF